MQVGNGQIVQMIQVTSGGEIKGAPAFWDGPFGPLVYVWGEQDYLKAFAFNGSTFNKTPITNPLTRRRPGHQEGS